MIPAATKGTDLTAYVGGTTAAYIDLGDRISEKLPSVILIVVALSFLLLMLAFRSILVPLTAALMNLLSVAAAYGVLTAVFEKGWGDDADRPRPPDPDRQLRPAADVRDPLRALDGLPGVPGLADRRGLARDAATTTRRWSRAWRSAARVITSAALIMVCVFASFILNGDPTVKQFGVGLAVAIAVDATIVRCLLVPAAMVLLGERNWWLPGWLDRILPRRRPRVRGRAAAAGAGEPRRPVNAHLEPDDDRGRQQLGKRAGGDPGDRAAA